LPRSVPGSVPRLLLLTRTPPGYAGVGGVFLKDLWEAYPSGGIHCFTLARSRWHVPPPEVLKAGHAWAPAPWSPATRRLGPLGTALGVALRGWRRGLVLPRLIHRVTSFATERRVDAVWAALNDPSTIRLAAPVAERLRVPLLPTVWDPPEAIADKVGLDALSRRSLLRAFDRTLRRAERCGVASENMAAEYRGRYGVETVVLIHGVRPELRRPAAHRPVTGHELTLGFAGTVYAREEWVALLSALDDVGWEVAGRQVRIRVLGHGADFLSHRENVELFGWQPLEEVLRILAATDLLYLPYWLDPSYEVSTRLCFPNKLTTYLAAGRPVFFHGPQSSSPAEFFTRYPAGVSCHSRTPEEILAAIQRIVEDPALYSAATRAGQRALDEELGLSVFHRRFAQLVGIPESSLTSSPQSD